MTDHRPESERTPPPSSSETAPHTLTQVVPPVAILAVATLVLGRVVAPSLQGIGVGMGRVIHAVDVVGDVLSQIFAVVAVTAALLAVVAAARSRLPLVVRLGALTLGGFVVLPTLVAVFQPVPPLSAALVGASAATLALLGAGSSMRAPIARPAAAVLGLIALGGLVRLVAVFLAYKALDHGGALRFGALARAVATAAFVIDALAVFAALAWTASRSRRLASPATVVALGFALLATNQALLGRAEDARPLALFFWRAAEQLMGRPEPSMSLAVRVFVAFLAPAAAVSVLASRNVVPTVAACAALALAARGAPEIPLCALMLVIAALGLALVARDERGMWAAISHRSGGRDT